MNNTDSLIYRHNTEGHAVGDKIVICYDLKGNPEYGTVVDANFLGMAMLIKPDNSPEE